MGIVRKTTTRNIILRLFNENNSINCDKLSIRLGKLKELFDTKVVDNTPPEFELLNEDGNIKILRINNEEVLFEVIYTETDTSYNARLAAYNAEQQKIQDRLDSKEEKEFNTALDRIRAFLEKHGYSVVKD